MSSCYRFCITMAMIAVIPATAGAQRAAMWRDSAQRLKAAVRALSDSLVQGDSSATEVGREGTLVIAASPNERSTALEALAMFARARTRIFGSAMPTPDGFRIVVQTRDGRSITGSRGLEEQVGTVVLTGLPDTGRSVRTQRTTTSSNVAGALIARFGEMMYASAPEAVTGWLENPPEWTTPEHERRDVAMYTLVTGLGPSQRRCVSGDLAGCALALDLHHTPRGEGGPVFNPPMRVDILLLALQIGRADAWQRFVTAAPDGMAPALSAAASMPIDSLLARWRSTLLARRPVEKPLNGRIALAAVAWTVLGIGTWLGVSRWA